MDRLSPFWRLKFQAETLPTVCFCGGNVELLLQPRSRPSYSSAAIIKSGSVPCVASATSAYMAMPPKGRLDPAVHLVSNENTRGDGRKRKLDAGKPRQQGQALCGSHWKRAHRHARSRMDAKRRTKLKLLRLLHAVDHSGQNVHGRCRAIYRP